MFSEKEVPSLRTSSCGERMQQTRVYFLDQTSVTFQLSPSVRIVELRDSVAWRLGLPGSHGKWFELYASTAGLAAGAELAHDELVSKPKLLYAARQISDVLVGTRRKGTLRLLYAQAVFRVTSGFHACPDETAVVLASLQLRAGLHEKAASEDALTEPGVHLEDLVPRPLLKSRSPDDWQTAILDDARKDDNDIEGSPERRRRSSPAPKDGDVYRSRYLDVVERWSSYGVEVYACAEVAVYVDEKTPVARTRGDAALGVSRDGVALLVANPKSTTPTAARFFEAGASSVHLDLRDLARWGHHGTDFYVDVGAEAAAPLVEATRRAGGPANNVPHKCSSVRLACVVRDAAKIANVLREFALAKLSGGGSSDNEDDKQSQPPTRSEQPRRRLSVEDRRLRTAAATRIATIWRGARLRRAWCRADAAITVQCLWRAALCRIRVRLSFLLYLTHP